MIRKYRVPIIIGVLIFVFLFLDSIVNTITNWQWFRAVDYHALFFRPFVYQWIIYIVTFVFGTVFFYLNLNYLSSLLITPRTQVYLFETNLAPYIDKLQNIGKMAKIGISAFIGIIWATFFHDFWLSAVYYFSGEPVGEVDPVFGRDVSFYLFELPFYQQILSSITSLVVFTLIVTLVIYIFRGIITWGILKNGGWSKGYDALKHLNLLIGILLLIFALNAYLGRFGLLFSEGGAIFGAGHTDINATSPVYLILTIIGVLGFILTLINFKIGRFKYTLAAIGVFLLVFIGGNVYAYFLQSFIVSPNELSMERPYIENHLEMTRKAYNLHDINEEMWDVEAVPEELEEEEIELEEDMEMQENQQNLDDMEDVEGDNPAAGEELQKEGLDDARVGEDTGTLDELGEEDIEDVEEEGIISADDAPGEIDEVPEIHEDIRRNIRLLDYRPLHQVYRESQEFRRYYYFNDVDIDRYTIDDEYHQVMLSARELDVNRLEEGAQTNINRHLKYTHGHGIAMSPVGEFTLRGHPRFFLQDVPVQDNVGIGLERPQIYFGEMKNDFVVVNSDEKEFSYPGGGEEVEHEYEGETGISIDNIFNRVLYALRERNSFILLSGEFNPESQILINRNIKERVNKIAPFLTYDDDPYIVVEEGQLYWIIDAYVESSNYPYSEPYAFGGGSNYIRNPVKVVVDAYTGEVDFYQVEEEPITSAISNAFPELFKELEEMPESLRDHIRYPVDLFQTQAEILKNYHMTDPVVFYNREDAWDIATERYYGDTVQMEPYYATLNLSEEEVDPEFVLMLPYTPVGRNNMISWLGARNDGEDYGELVLYRFPRGTLAYGPRQIDARIDQDPEISRLISLWDREGSRVIRGNLLVIPLENGILYVEPIYLEAEGASFPEMRRVIVAWQDDLIMAENLKDALAYFGVDDEDIDIEEPDVPVDPEVPEEELPEEIYPGEEFETISELSEKALELYLDAEEAIREGDWGEYGEIQKELRDILERLEEKSKETIETVAPGEGEE